MAPNLTLAAAVLFAATAAVLSSASVAAASASADDDNAALLGGGGGGGGGNDAAERLRAALAAAVAAGRSAVRQLRRQSTELARLRSSSSSSAASANGETARKRSNYGDSEGESAVAAACGADAVALGGHCRSVRRLFGLQMDTEAAALCDGHRLCSECAAAYKVEADAACDEAFAETAARACLGEANPVACGRQADQLLAAMRMAHRPGGRRLLLGSAPDAAASAAGAACSRVCAETLFS